MATQLLEKLRLLQDLVTKDESEDVVLDATVSKLLSYELDKLVTRQQQVREKLAVFEQRYSLETRVFTQQFRAGRMGDKTDFFEWIALADIDQELAQQVARAEKLSDASEDQSPVR